MTSFREGLPKSVMEAMAMELPVVAYNIRGVKDLVIDSETGLLVSFRDAKSLAEKLIFLCLHPDEYEKMGEMGRKRIENEFSLEIIKKQMRELYQEILRGDDKCLS